MITSKEPLEIEGRSIEWWADRFDTLIGRGATTAVSAADHYLDSDTHLDVTEIVEQQGQLFHHNGSNWDALDPGTDTQILATQGSGSDAHWVWISDLTEDTSPDTVNDMLMYDDVDEQAHNRISFDDLLTAILNSTGTEKIQDIVGEMTTSNTETFITVTYQDADGTIDFVVPVKDEDNMASNSDTFLATQQSIKAYVDSNVGGGAPTDTQYVTLALDGDLSAERTLNPGTGLTGTDAGANGNYTLDVDVGIADNKIVQVDDADAADNDYARFTANGLEGRSYAEMVGTDLAEEIEGLVGAMVTGNTETGISVTYEAGDGTLDFVLDWGEDGDIQTVDLSANDAGTLNEVARADHKHDLDETIIPTWSGKHTFSTGIEMSSSAPIGSDDYASQTTGWRVTQGGAADFRYLYVDEMHAESFIADLEQALAGGQIITKSVSKLSDGHTFTVPVNVAISEAVQDVGPDYFKVSGNYSDQFEDVTFKVTGSDDNDGTYVCSTDAWNGSETFIFVSGYTLTDSGASGTITAATDLMVDDLPSASGMAVFEANDWVGIKTMSRAGGSLTISWVYGQVSGYTDNGDGTQTWDFVRAAGDSPDLSEGDEVTAGPGTLVLDFGQDGDCDGFYEVTAIDGNYGENSPYAQVVTWDTHPSTQTVRARMGNLKGITSTLEHGLFAGDGHTNSDQYLLISDQNVELHNIDFQIHDGSNLIFDIDYSVPSLALGTGADGMDFSTVDGVWMGWVSGDSAYKFRVGDPSGVRLQWDGADLLIGDPSNANMLWDADAGGDGTGQLKFRGGSTTEAYIDTEGSIVAGAGDVTLDSDGVRLSTKSSFYNSAALTWGDTNDRARIYSLEMSAATEHGLRLVSLPYSGYTTKTVLNSKVDQDSNDNAIMEVSASVDGMTPWATALELWVDESNNRCFANIRGDYGKFVGLKVSTAGAGSVPTAMLEVEEDTRIGGGLYVGATDTAPSSGEVRATGYTSGLLPMGVLHSDTNLAGLDPTDYGSFTSIITGSLDNVALELERYSQWLYVHSSQDASNYWEVKLVLMDSGATQTAVDTWDTKSESTGDVYWEKSVDHSCDAGDMMVFVQVKATGSPGNLSMAIPAIYCI